MKPVRRINAVAVPFDESNIDTDQLAPIRFLVNPVFPDLLLYDRRFNKDGSARGEFVLNQPAYAGAEIIVTRSNFGVGSSREFAVMALLAAKIRCVIAVSFGDIFYNNCLQNGVLPVSLVEQEIDALLGALHAQPGIHVNVDLLSQSLTARNCGPYRFRFNAMRKRCFMEGLDDIELTDRYSTAIAAFELDYHRAHPWLA